LDGLAVPDRVRELIGSRVAALDPVAKDVLAAAAVIGHEVEFELLRRVLGGTAGDLASTLEDLTRLHLLRSSAARLSFAHHRIREVVYRDLSIPRRRLLHGAVAE